jgi:hypothetical protein
MTAAVVAPHDGVMADDLLARTKAALEIVGKAHALLEQRSESVDSEPRSGR